MWYGSKLTGDLNFGTSYGELTSDPMLLPAASAIGLTLSYFTHKASGLRVEVESGGAWKAVWFMASPPLESWVEQAIDLTAYAAKTVRIRISYKTISSTAKGVYVDDVALTATCP
jgi:hypothetical protein